MNIRRIIAGMMAMCLVGTALPAVERISDNATAVLQSIGNADKYALSEQGRKNADCYNTGDGITGTDALAIQLFELGVIKSFTDDFVI